jgi:hypothetical protein
VLRLSERVEDKALDAITDVAVSHVQERVTRRRRGHDIVLIYGPDGTVLREVKVPAHRR